VGLVTLGVRRVGKFVGGGVGGSGGGWRGEPHWKEFKRWAELRWESGVCRESWGGTRAWESSESQCSGVF